MSLVGPRPQVAWAVKLYTPEERRLLDVRPGITDYASIAFRNEGEILRGHPDPDAAYLKLIAPEKIRLGLKYVDEQSLRVDCGILLHTARCVLQRGAKEAA
jgi:lipopolysaccharide/colanic/teichoic acid biosynthesis glycosyltransferase